MCRVMERALDCESGEMVSRLIVPLTSCAGLGVGMNLYLTFSCRQRPYYGTPPPPPITITTVS